MNQFRFSKVLVSPMRRTIETAVNALKRHPQLYEEGITLQLAPLAKGILTNASGMCVSRNELNKLIDEIQE